MKIVRLTAQNFMNLKAVEIEPKGSTVLITGKNEAGKSNVIKAIETALCGKKAMPDEPIRDNEEEAEITVETENYIVRRTITKDGTKLIVEDAEGQRAKSPQALLDKIVGEIAFDPTKFIEMNEKDQYDTLMEMLGLDFSELEGLIAKKKAERSVVKSAKETAEHDAQRITKTEGLPAEEVSVTEVMAKMQKAMEHNAEQVVLKSDIENVGTDITNAEESQEATKGLLEDLGNRISELMKQCDDAKVRIQKNADLIEGLGKRKETLGESLEPIIDIATIQGEVDTLEETNMKIRANIERKGYIKKARDKQKEFADLGKKMKRFTDDKAGLLAKAKMPIEGLSVRDGMVVYKDRPLKTGTNTAKQLQVSVAISMALNPTLKVIRMSGNDLDDDSLALISEMVKEKDYQIWIEKVDTTGKVGIVIEDGSIKQ